MTKDNWLLFLLGFKGHGESPALDPVRIQKGMFLLAKEAELPEQERYDFEPYNWGPYSRELRRDLDRLVIEGYVQAKPVPGYSWKRYSLTNAGVDVARDLLKEAPSATCHKVAETKRHVSAASFSGLLQDVYAKYPEYAANSLFGS